MGADKISAANEIEMHLPLWSSIARGEVVQAEIPGPANSQCIVE